MKTIKIPEPVDIGEGSNVVTWPMFKFVDAVCDQHAAFGRGLSGIRQGSRILDVFESGCQHETVELEGSDYEELKTALNTAAFNPKYGRKFIPFYEAIEGAEKPTGK